MPSSVTLERSDLSICPYQDRLGRRIVRGSNDMVNRTGTVALGCLLCVLLLGARCADSPTAPTITVVRFTSTDTPIAAWEGTTSSTIGANRSGTVMSVRYSLTFRSTWGDPMNVRLQHEGREDYVREETTPTSYERTTTVFNGLQMSGDWVLKISLTDLPSRKENFLDTWWIEISYSEP